jgi:hypothetical protein
MRRQQALRVYELYGQPGGSLSARSVDYDGDLLHVVAVNIWQAYFFAANDRWAKGPDDSAGIVEWGQRNHGWTLWDGQEGLVSGTGLEHGDRPRRIRELMRRALAQG